MSLTQTKRTNDTRPRGRDAKDPKKNQLYEPYINSILTIKVPLSITEIGKNIKQNLELKIKSLVENKCIVEGYVAPNSVMVLSYSAGMVSADFITFHVCYSCKVSYPVEGMLLEAKVRTTTKAGIHAQVVDKNGNIPITVFVARDHHPHNNQFNNVNENDTILVKVIGQRFELNDSYICVIASLETPL